MPDPEFYFKNKKEQLDWFEKEIPESYLEYLETKKIIKESNFSGSSNLLKREASDETIENFLTGLTEINLANLLIRKKVKDLTYEPKGISGVDFSFDKILLSAKSLNAKNYEIVEHDEIEKMKEADGGKNVLQHKGFSDTLIEVEKNSMGTHTYSRIETGHSGFLDSDIAQMSPPLEYIGRFEDQANGVDGYKKVLFILPYSSQFKPYHMRDIALWYFDCLPKGYHRIFNNDLNWYAKLLKKARKDNTIDAIILMLPPRPLIWPNNCFGEAMHKQNRVEIYTRDPELLKQLKYIFS
jgi:hypothetical protein